jgi:hypothetical protein
MKLERVPTFIAAYACKHVDRQFTLQGNTLDDTQLVMFTVTI